MNPAKEFTYMVRLRRTNGNVHDPDRWQDGTSYSHPLIVSRQGGTDRAGWPWARYDKPWWTELDSARDMAHALRIIAADLEVQLEDLRDAHKAERIRATVTAPVLVRGVVTLGDAPKDDNYQIIAN